MPDDPPGTPSPRPRLSLFSGLKVKFVAALVVLVGVVIGLSTWWSLHAHTGHMLQATEDKVQALADAIDGGIQVAMREGHTDEIRRLLTAMARDPDIEQIVLLDDRRTVREASRPDLVGRTLDPDRASRYLARRNSVAVERYENGTPVRSVVRAIRNRPECRACHGTPETLGTLYIDLSYGQTQVQIAEMERTALWSLLFTGLVLAAGGGVLMTRLVDRRIARLAGAMSRVQAGDLAARADLGPPDELGRLAASFNAMVDRLSAAREEIEAYHRQRLARAERLATLGELAASLAHEIKNPLAGIAGAVRVMADELPATDQRKEIMEEILDQVHRLDKTVHDLLTFVRPATPALAPCDIHQVLDRVLVLLAQDPAAKRVRISRSYEAGLPPVRADGKQLGQVFLNLLLNAVQAMPGGGRITLRTAPSGADGAGPDSSVRAVEVRVSDTGPGIQAHQIPEVFAPFFTTKPRGAGLGLSICRRIVEDHGGRIDVESPPGEGATFRVILPLGAADGRPGGLP